LNNLGWKLFNAFFPRILESFARCLAAYIENDKIFTSAQVGKPCEYKVNETALIISTGPNETRIQPNATCPVEK
jgi:hypothetical protein